MRCDISFVLLAPFAFTRKMHAGWGKLQTKCQYFCLKKAICMCAIRFCEFLKTSSIYWLTGSIQATMSYQPAAAFQSINRYWYSVHLGCSPGSPLHCALCSPACESVPLSFALQITPPPMGCISLLAGTHLVSSIAPFLYFLSPHPLPPHAPNRPDNDVLIMRLLGQQIALSLIRMQWKFAAVLESPPCCVYQAGWH